MPDGAIAFVIWLAIVVAGFSIAITNIVRNIRSERKLKRIIADNIRNRGKLTQAPEHVNCRCRVNVNTRATVSKEFERAAKHIENEVKKHIRRRLDDFFSDNNKLDPEWRRVVRDGPVLSKEESEQLLHDVMDDAD